MGVGVRRRALERGTICSWSPPEEKPFSALGSPVPWWG